MKNLKALAGLVLLTLSSTPAVAPAGVADSIYLGTTDRVVSLDPAGAYDLGSQQLIGNLYQNLLTIPAGGNQPKPDAAKRCAFKNAKTYVCTLRSGLKFSNGDRLTAADVKFSFDRMIQIADPSGPSSLLASRAPAHRPAPRPPTPPPATADPTAENPATTHHNRGAATWPFILTHMVGA